MSAPLKAIDGTPILPALMTDLATRARAARECWRLPPPNEKSRTRRIERAIRANASAILAANAEDVAEVRATGNGGLHRSADADASAHRCDGRRPRRDRARYRRSIGIVTGELATSERHGHRARAGAARCRRGDFRKPPQCLRPTPALLCLKSGNAVILRGGSTVFAPAASTTVWCRDCAKPICLRLRSRWCRPVTDRRWACC